MNKKIIQLNHPATPPALLSLNDQLSSLLGQDVVEESELLRLVEERDVCVQEQLAKFADPAQRQAFAKAELDVNQQLVRFAQGLMSESLQKFSALKRGQRAVKHYK